MKALPINKHALLASTSTYSIRPLLKTFYLHADPTPISSKKIKVNESPILNYYYSKYNYVHEMTYKE